MTTDDQFPRPDSNSFDGEGSRPGQRAARKPPKKKGMSPLLMVLLVFVGLGGLGFLLCLGGGFFLYSQSDFEFDDDPEVVIAQTAEMMEIEIMEGLEPASWVHINMLVMTITMVGYEREIGEGFLLIGEVDVAMSAMDDDEMEREVRGSMAGEESSLRIEEMEFREFEIRGETAEFQFGRGEDRETGKPGREVSGVFPGRGKKRAIMMLQIDEEQYDEEAVIAMIESIR